MEVRETRDRDAIELFLRRDAAAHVYALADLDDFFWPDTTWYAGYESGEMRSLCLILKTLDPPILYALDPNEQTSLRELLSEVQARLPRCVFATFSPELESWFRAQGSFLPHGLHDKMILEDRGIASWVSTQQVESLDSANLAEVQSFLANEAYLGDERDARFFEPYMLERGPYFGIREAGRLVSMGGVHVHSRERSVAAIGNLVTRPDRRRRGLGRAVSAALLGALSRTEHIGLNVQRTNSAAIRCYESLGFRRVCPYWEATVTR